MKRIWQHKFKPLHKLRGGTNQRRAPVGFFRRQRVSNAALFTKLVLQNGDFGHYFKDHSSEFGDRMTKTRAFGDDLEAKLRDMLDHEKADPFIVIRGLLPTHPIPFIPLSFVRVTERFIRNGRYDVISAGLIHLCGCDHVSKGSGTPWKDFRTSPFQQKHQRFDGGDMPLRYRSATPEGRFPSDEHAKDQDNLSARVMVIVCVENTRRDPIWLLPVSNLIDKLSPEERALLQKQDFAFFGSFTPLGMHDQIVEDKSVLSWSVSGNTPWLSFDVNRLNLQFQRTGNDHKKALARLSQEIDRQGQNEESGAIPVRLKKGDVLVIDNYRVLHSRKEQNVEQLWLWPFGEPRRHLRVYYGLPKYPGTVH